MEAELFALQAETQNRQSQVCYIQTARVLSSRFAIGFRPGNLVISRSESPGSKNGLKENDLFCNSSGLLTQCLQSAAFGLHRSSIGFEIMDFPFAGLVDLARGYVFVEVCCKQDSAISRACKKLGLVYVGIAHNMEKPQVFQELVKTLKGLEPCNVFVHVSSPWSLFIRITIKESHERRRDFGFGCHVV